MAEAAELQAVRDRCSSDGRTGLHFAPGDAADLGAKVEWAWTHPEEMEEMGARGAARIRGKVHEAANYRRLMEIYEMVMASNRTG